MEHLIDPPEPGVYPDVPMSEYLAWDAASSSRINELRKSPAHLREQLEEDEEDTKAQRMGKLIHTAVLEPELFYENYEVLGECDGELSDGSPCTNNAAYTTDQGQFCNIDSHGIPKDDSEEGPEAVKQDEFDTCKGVIDSVWNKKYAVALLEDEGGGTEMSLVWQEKIDGLVIPCKARIDADAPNRPSGPTIADIKTARDVTKHGFTRDMYRWGYHYKVAHYLRGARALGFDREYFCMIAVEKNPPYPCAIYEPRGWVVDSVMPRLEKLLAAYQRIRIEDTFPGLPDEIQKVGMPDWVEQSMDRDVELVLDSISQITE